MGRNIVLIDPSIPGEELKHYGVLGMRWGKRKGIVGTGDKGKVTRWDKKKYDMKERQSKLKAKGKTEQAGKIGDKINEIERRNEWYLYKSNNLDDDDIRKFGLAAGSQYKSAAKKGTTIQAENVKISVAAVVAINGALALSDPGIRRAATNGAKKIFNSIT